MTGKQSTIETRSSRKTTITSVRSPVTTNVTVDAAQRRIIILGAHSDIPRALEHQAVVTGRFTVDAILTIDVESEDIQELGTRLLELLKQHDAEAVLVAGPIGRDAMRLVADLALITKCELLAVMPTELLAEHEPVVVWTGDSPVIQLTRAPWRGWQVATKRVADVVFAGVALIVTSPLIAVLAVLVRLESPGPAFFAHERVGHFGRRFKCLKLRTMRVGAEDLLRQDPALYEEYRQNHFKIPEERDPRTTSIGRFLRRTSMDELPQLLNVLRGEMSMVGPRPVVEDELAMYGSDVDLLLSVRPGITGAWAVSGRHDVGYPERCAIELSYVRNWSLTTDARIALGTVRVLVNVESR